MSDTTETEAPAADMFTEMLRIQGETARQAMEAAFQVPDVAQGAEALDEWRDAALKLQGMWLDFQRQQSLPEMPAPLFADPVQWMGVMQGWYQALPRLDPERQANLFAEGVALWENVLAQYGRGPKTDPDGPDIHLPREDRRFADPAWRKQPVYA